MNSRIPHIDMAAGVMILWMIVYHAISYAWGFDLRDYWGIADLSSLPDNVHAYIRDGNIEMINPCIYFPYLSFLMPWFFFKSGKFFKKREPEEHWYNDSRKLLRTFVIWSVIGYMLFLLFGWLQHSLSLRSATYSVLRGFFLTGKIPLNEPLWFLLTLFGVRFMANWILPQKEEKYYWLKLDTVIIIGYLVAFSCYRFNHQLLPYWVANGASGLVFFSLGYALRDYENKWWIVAPCAAVYVICCFVGFPIVDMMFNRLLSGAYLLWIPVAFCGIVVFDALCEWICKCIRVLPLEIVGRNAMAIYITHILVLQVVMFVIEYFELTFFCPYVLWCILVGYLLFIPPLCYLLIKRPMLLGEYRK